MKRIVVIRRGSTHDAAFFEEQTHLTPVHARGVPGHGKRRKRGA